MSCPYTICHSRSVVLAGLVCLLLTVPPAALAQPAAIYDIVCEITSVAVESIISEDEDVKAGDWMVFSGSAPPEGEPPTDTGAVPGGTGAFWDLERQNECAHVPPEDDTTTGAASMSRAIVENGDADAVGWDSIGAFFTLGETDIDRCGAGFRDSDGSTLETHEEFPESINRNGWTVQDCIMEGFVGEQLLTAIGNVKLVVRTNARGGVTLEVPRGDNRALIAAIIWINLDALVNPGRIIPVRFTGEDKPFDFVEPFAGSENALPVLTGKAQFLNAASFNRDITATSPFRFIHVAENGELLLAEFTTVGGFRSAGDGGAILVTDQAKFGGRADYFGNFAAGDGGALAVKDNASVSLQSSWFESNESEGNGGAIAAAGQSSVNLNTEESQSLLTNNTAGMDGGAVYREDKADLFIVGYDIIGNTAGGFGGAVSIQGDSIETEASSAVQIRGCDFRENESDQPGCDVHVDIEGFSGTGPDAEVEDSYFDLSCQGTSILNQRGNLVLSNLTYSNRDRSESVSVSSMGATSALNNVFAEDTEGGSGEQSRMETTGGTVESSCDGSAGIESLGYNISYDDSCGFDQPTDLVNTDAQLGEPDENGIRAPQPGSPAIDHGLSELVDRSGNGQLSLPCGYRDVTGLGAPQDGDGDGVFECDAGAVEVQGVGAIQPGHSGAFFNSLRNGEGQYVEILGSRAVIYTFSYTPDGTGAAWFVGLANVVGNSLVVDRLLRPIGTQWGDEFDADEIDFTAAGGQSMVFPACASGEPTGNVVFSGSRGLGYEPLITRAERLTDIVGCDATTTPHPNAGLSGSFFDAARNGEGLIIQWLPDGHVLVVMFTFTPDGKQMWLVGVGPSSGQSVTLEMLYPTGFTKWGSGFDAGEVTLEPWGEFALTWNGPDSLTFEYTSEISGYGSGTRNYQRLSTLAGTAAQSMHLLAGPHN